MFTPPAYSVPYQEPQVAPSQVVSVSPQGIEKTLKEAGFVYIPRLTWTSSLGKENEELAPVITSLDTDQVPVKNPDGSMTMIIGDVYAGKMLLTVGDFDRFKNATGHVPDSLKATPSSPLQEQPWVLYSGVDTANHDAYIPASYNHPFGFKQPKALPNMPATHITARDVKAYCDFLSKELSKKLGCDVIVEIADLIITEYIARGGDPKGSAPERDPITKGWYQNSWHEDKNAQGKQADGYTLLAPQDKFLPFKGFYAPLGHVWRMVPSSAVVSQEITTPEGEKKTISVNIDFSSPDQPDSQIVTGGSYACFSDGCCGNKPWATLRFPPTQPASHIGVRLVVRVPGYKDLVVAPKKEEPIKLPPVAR